MRRRGKVRLAIVVLVLAALGYFPLRTTVFAPHFDVPSIAATPQYKDPALMDRAWSLPVASTFQRSVVSQTNGSVCGPSSVANILRSLGDGSASQSKVIKGSGHCVTGLCIPGLTLDELAEMAQKKTTKKVTLLRDLTLEDLRAHLKRSNDPSRRYLANFHRGMLFGKGVGHHSPIAGYLEAEDLVLVLDVNGAFGPWLVSSERLFAAIDTIDTSTGKKRGLLAFE